MTCAKRRYRTDIAAKFALGRISAAIPDEDRPKRPVRTYRCPKCRGWHLTSQPKWGAA